MELSNFMQKFYSVAGYNNISKLFLDVFKNITLAQNIDLFNKDEYQIRKYCNGNRPLPKKYATYILSQLDKENFSNSMNEEITEDARTELCNVFENEVGVATKDNIMNKLADLLVKILKNLTQKQKETVLQTKLTPSNFSIDAELTNIVKTLATLPQEKLQDMLTYEPYNVDKKILRENANLSKDIKKDVVDYYRFIEKLFQEYSGKNSLFFDQIAEQIKTASDNYISQNLPQETIFYNMVDWLQHKVSFASPIACRIMISFFVQNCEVFHEIT